MSATYADLIEFNETKGNRFAWYAACMSVRGDLHGVGFGRSGARHHYYLANKLRELAAL